MKKNRITILLVLVLAIAAIILLMVKNKNNTLDDKNTRFAVEDTASITKIFLADKQNRTVLLKKEAEGKWTVNEKYDASSEVIKLLLKTVMSLEVKDPIAKPAKERIMGLMATRSVKVEIYQMVYRINLFDKIRLFPHEKNTRTYYVGVDAKDNLGTYMLLENSDTPYIVYILGFNGFLSTRYSTNEKDWRDHTIFKLKYNQVKMVSVRFPDLPENSFKAVKKSPKDFELYRLKDNEQIFDYDTVKLMDLFSFFGDIRYEVLLNDMEADRKDSIISSPVYIEVTVEDESGKKYSVTTFKRKAPEGEFDQQGNPVIFDRDRLYALINGKKDFVLIQYYVFGQIFKPLDFYFQSSEKPVADN